MSRLLSTTALAAVLALGVTPAAMAQGQQASQPTSGQSHQPQLQQAEQVLRQAQQGLSGSAQGNQQQMLQQARQAVSQTQQAIGQVPSGMQGQEAYKKAQQQLSEAQSALQGDQPDRQKAATELREAADAVGSLHGGMNGANASSGNASGARIAVQQQAPQVTVQQPAPQVTVQQPQPQITVQQPPPQVTVQQPQPQVTVQQAQPQVHVQQQGQPQVTVQRQGEPQVNVQQGQQHSSSQGNTNSTTTDTQRNAANQQAAATNAGVPLTRVQSLVGTNVVGADGKDAGEVQNLLIDSKGQVRAAIVQWGGFLGLGESSAAVPIDRIQLGASGNERARLNMTKEELERLPRYEKGNAASYGRDQGWGDVRPYS